MPSIYADQTQVCEEPVDNKKLQCALCKRFESECKYSWYSIRYKDPTKEAIALCDYCFTHENNYKTENLNIEDDDDDDDDDEMNDDNDDNMPVYQVRDMNHGRNEEYKGFFSRNKIESSTFEFNTSKRLVGCEIEVDGLRRPVNKNIFCTKIGRNVAYNNAVLWDAGAVAVYDGSLQSGGFEICTFPANGDAFINQITSITEAINNQRPIISSNCGLHIHVDATDYTAKDVTNFMKLYCLIEHAIFSTLPPSRKDNRYCAKITEDKNNLNFLFTKGVKSSHVAMRTAYDCIPNNKSNLEYLKRCKKPDSRYKAVNLSSWFYQGTIEFRMFSGTTSAEKIITWCNFWSNLLTLVKTTLNTPKKIHDFFDFSAPCEHSGIPMRLTNFEINAEFSWKCLMKVCSSDAQRAWFTKRKLKFK